MRISEFSQKANLPRDTVRYYEKLGLLKPLCSKSDTNQYRDYTCDDLERVATIKLGQTLGFTLREIKSLIVSMESKTLTDDRKRAVIKDKVKRVEMQIAQLNKIRRYFLAKIRWMERGGVGDPPQFDR